jgi:hypothetical protein
MTVEVLAGPVRRPRNIAAVVAASIDDDDTATPLGFRGGTVAGGIHIDQFRHATTDLEPVRAFLERPPRQRDVQTRAWATTSDDCWSPWQARMLGAASMNVASPATGNRELLSQRRV